MDKSELIISILLQQDWWYFSYFSENTYIVPNVIVQTYLLSEKPDKTLPKEQFDLFVLRFYGPVNPIGSCWARSVYLTTRLLGRLSPLSG